MSIREAGFTIGAVARRVGSIPEVGVAAGVAGLATAFAGLIARNLFVVFPYSTRTGDARMQVWLGPDGAKFAYTALATLITLMIAATAAMALRRVARDAWAAGAVVGVLSGFVAGSASFLVDASATTLAALDTPQTIYLVLLWAGPILAGAVAFLRSHAVEGGAIAGFWCAMIGTLLFVVMSIAALEVFALRLESGPWLTGSGLTGVAGCAGAAGARLGSCRSGDVVGGLANGLLIAPTIGLVLGMISAAVVAAVRRKIVTRTLPVPALAPAVGLCGVFSVILVVELRANLW